MQEFKGGCLRALNANVTQENGGRGDVKDTTKEESTGFDDKILGTKKTEEADHFKLLNVAELPGEC